MSLEVCLLGWYTDIIDVRSHLYLLLLAKSSTLSDSYSRSLKLALPIDRRGQNQQLVVKYISRGAVLMYLEFLPDRQTLKQGIHCFIYCRVC